MDRVIVIGGGPAGMMAAGTAGLQGKKVLLVEKNSSLGRKLLLTGKGRCNLTNATDIDGLLAHILKNRRFMYSSFQIFASEELVDFFQGLGLPTKVERGRRVFPASGSSYDVLKALKLYLERGGVEVIRGEGEKLLFSKEKVEGVQLKDGRKLLGESVVLALGGLSYPATGSTGDGYGMAKEVGHTISCLRPSLVPLRVKEGWINRLAGLQLKNCTLRITDERGEELYKGFGEVHFMEDSLTGPLPITASALLGQIEGKGYKAVLDVKPALREDQLHQRLLRDFEKYSNKTIAKALKDLLPQQLQAPIIALSSIHPTKKVHQITKGERQKLIGLLKNLTFTLLKRGSFQEAIITAGGVVVDEVYPLTMESKKKKNLFFAGEILALEALTGGFNLQIAFTTGYVAGLNC